MFNNNINSDDILGFNKNFKLEGLDAEYNWRQTRERLDTEFNDKIKRYSKEKKFDFIKERARVFVLIYIF